MLRLGALFALAALPAAIAAPAEADRFSLQGAVTHVVDGDTLHVRLMGGRVERVRLLGIDTPKVGVCGAPRATAGARSLAERLPAHRRAAAGGCGKLACGAPANRPRRETDRRRGSRSESDKVTVCCFVRSTSYGEPAAAGARAPRPGSSSDA